MPMRTHGFQEKCTYYAVYQKLFTEDREKPEASFNAKLFVLK